MNRLNERGAALLIVLLFTVLLFIVVTAMFGTVGNEVIIAGTHRDSVRALEHAQAGLEEGIRRIEAGRQYSNPSPFPGSLAPGISVEVVDVVLGQGGAYLEVRSDAQVGQARRRLSTLLLARATTSSLGDIVFGYSLASQGAAEVTGGDVYSETFVDYKRLPTDPASITFSAWAIRKRSPSPIPWCYQFSCAGQPNWRPGTRRSAYRDAQFRPTGIPNVNPVPDTRSGASVLNFTCPPGPGPIAPYDTQTIGGSGPGYMAGDRRADLSPTDPGQAAVASEKLYGCDLVDNRPYTWVRVAIDTNGDGVVDDVDGDGRPETLWMKTVIFEDWFNDYWVFCEAVGNPVPECTANKVLSYIKRSAFQSNPALAAIPPFPDFDALKGNYDEYQSGGGTINASTTLNLGCKAPEMTCPGGLSTPTIVLLENGDYHINANLQGHGILLVDGDLVVNGTFEYWGLLMVRGKLQVGNGTVTIHGGLIAEDTVELSGTIEVEAGISLTNRLIGPATVTRKTWWER